MLPRNVVALISHLDEVLRTALEDLQGTGVAVPHATLGIVAGDTVHFTADPPDCWLQVRQCVHTASSVARDGLVVVPVSDPEGVRAVVVLEGEPLPASTVRILQRHLAAELTGARRLVRMETLLRHYTAGEIAEELVAGDGHDPDEDTGGLRDLTVLFADLRGFTRFSEKTASEVVVSYLNELFEPAIAVVHDHGGSVFNLMGDAIMATFGATGDQPDHPYLAARAALALTTTLAQAHPDLPRFGVGVNTGAAYVGNIGGRHRRVFTSIGDTVNLAARLEAGTAPGSVTIGEETYRSIRPLADVEPLEPLDLKGVEQPVQAFRLLALDDASIPADTFDRSDWRQDQRR